jgi:hypothetical protein
MISRNSGAVARSATGEDVCYGISRTRVVSWWAGRSRLLRTHGRSSRSTFTASGLSMAAGCRSGILSTEVEASCSLDA